MRQMIFFVLLAGCVATQTDRSVTVWLIPIENAGSVDIERSEEIGKEVEAFNREFAGSRITVENTTDPILKMKLLAWNPAFAVPNAAVVINQRRTLHALEQFARQKQIDVHVRFITWDEAFPLISDLKPARRSAGYPDVVQIGSTWDAYLADRGLIMSRPHWPADRGNWKDVLDLSAAELPYITDVRLLFYWKRLPTSSPESREFVLNTSSWSAVVASIRERANSGDTIVFPTGLTLNVLHDYAPLVWSGGAQFLSRGWFGQRIDLTSAKALAVPLLLQANALDLSRPNQPRRLITFPEASHEEVDRIFVNGGYRVTQEPANFMDRWRQDFQRRHTKDGIRFWDYAGAAVPPRAFRGGSDLVVLRGSSNPDAAFSLADFLAGDPEFTTILAEAGHLPAGRRGYGTDVLATALSSGGGPSPDVDRFVDAVQKAIEQGVAYPQMASWPEQVENRQVQEALQVVWRRMGESDPEELKRAARKAEWLINSHTSWFDQFVNVVIEARWALAAILVLAVGIAVYFVFRRIEAQRQVILLLSLYRAHRHDAAKFLGQNFHGIARRACVENWDFATLSGKVLAVSQLFETQLVPHIENIADNQQKEMAGHGSAIRLDQVIYKAWSGAGFIYEAKETLAPPYVHFAGPGLDQWMVHKLPHALLIVLEEWFLNSIKHFVGNNLERPSILVKLERGELILLSSGQISSSDLGILREAPEGTELTKSRQGLKLIRNILHYAYAMRATVENTVGPDGLPRILLRMPLRKILRPA